MEMVEINENSSLDELFTVVEKIKNKRDLIFIKFDGERDINHITVIISYPSNLEKEQIRFDGNNLKKVLYKAINSYFM